MNILGVIIAGGKSKRMGAEKAFAKLGRKTLIVHVVDRLMPQVEDIVINANGDPKRFHFLEFDIIPDIETEIDTPLAGIHAALSYADEEGYDAVVTVPSDSPFLPHDLIRKLAGTKPAFANSKGQDHFITGFWPVKLLANLEKEMHKSNRVQDWVFKIDAAKVNWRADDYDPFMNINTPADMAAALKILPKVR
jgi:molybdenum cofactor guanylyltransferase